MPAIQPFRLFFRFGLVWFRNYWMGECDAALKSCQRTRSNSHTLINLSFVVATTAAVVYYTIVTVTAFFTLDSYFTILLLWKWPTDAGGYYVPRSHTHTHTLIYKIYVCSIIIIITCTHSKQQVGMSTIANSNFWASFFCIYTHTEEHKHSVCSVQSKHLTASNE